VHNAAVPDVVLATVQSTD